MCVLYCCDYSGIVTTQQAIMLTRCTGSLLVKHTPEERMAFCDKVCGILQSVGEHVTGIATAVKLFS